MRPPADEDDDFRVGIPRPGVAVAPPLEPPPAPRTPPEAEIELRQDDSELGRPVQVMADQAPLSAADRADLAGLDAAQAEQELREAEELLAASAGGFWLGAWAAPLAAALLLGSAGALGLFLFAQTLSVLNSLAALPEVVRYPGYAALLIFGVAVLIAAARLLRVYARLERNEQLRMEGLAELRRRTRLRRLAHGRSEEAIGKLKGYLEAFPLDPADRRGPGRLLSAERREELRRERERLLDDDKRSTSGEWFTQFRGGFQARLDAAAEERIAYWSNRAMLTTAVAPNALIDSVATLYFGFALLHDLCRVYNLRAGRSGTAVLLARVFVNAYLAGNLSDFEKLAEDQYDHLFEQAFHIVGIGVGTNVAGKFLGKVGAKATAGYLNKLLLGRLGRHACRMLRPVEA